MHGFIRFYVVIVVINILIFSVYCSFQRETINDNANKEKLLVFEILQKIRQRASAISEWQATDMTKFYPKLVGKLRQNSGINRVEVSLMRKLDANLGKLSADDVGIYKTGHRCSIDERNTQVKSYNMTIPALCTEIEAYKITQLAWPDADRFIDIGVNRGFISALMISLWSENGYKISPFVLALYYLKHGLFKGNGNPYGACRTGLNRGYPLYCSSGLREVDGECIQPNPYPSDYNKHMVLHAVDGSSFIIRILKHAIKNMLDHSHTLKKHHKQEFKWNISDVWTVHHYAMSDRIGEVQFTHQNESSRPGYEGGRLYNGAADVPVEVVDMTTVDLFVKQYNMTDRVDILKIDAESAETMIIKGAIGLISSHRVALVIWENDSILLDLINILNSGDNVYECYSAMPSGFLKLTNECLDIDMMKSRKNAFGNVFCASPLLIPGVVAAFDALSYYQMD